MSYTVDFSKYFVGKPNSNDVEIRNVLPCRFVKVYRNDKLEIDYSVIGKIFTETIQIPNTTQYIKSYTSSVNDSRIILVPRDGNLVGAARAGIHIFVTWEDGYSQQFDINEIHTNDKLYVDIPSRGMKVTSWYINFANNTNMIFILFTYRIADYNNLVGTINDVKFTDTIRIEATNFYSNFPALNYNLINTTWENRVSLHLFVNGAENIVVDKTRFLSQEKVLNGVLRENCSIINPVIQIELFDIDIIYNYCYIPRFQRYYYINNINVVRANLFELEMSVDVLNTHSAVIYSMSGLIGRNEFDYNEMIPDNNVPFTNEVEGVIYTFTNFYTTWYKDEDTPQTFYYRFDNLSYIMVCYTELDLTANEYDAVLRSPNITSATTIQYFDTVNEFSKCINSLINPNIWESIGDKFVKATDYLTALFITPLDIKGAHEYFGETGPIAMSEETKPFIGPVSYADGKCNLIYGNSRFKIWSKINSNLSINSFLDKEPYSTYSLYLPFIGIVPINSNLIELGHLNYITYEIDITTGDFTASFSKNEPTAYNINLFSPLYFNGNMFTQLPFGITNAADIHRNQFLQSMNFLESGLQTIAGVQKGFNMRTPKKKVISKGGYSTISSSLEQGSSDIKSTLLDAIVSNTPTAQAPNLPQSVLNFKKCSYPYIIKYKTNYYYPPNYNHLYGRPLMEGRILQDLRGFTVVEDFHINSYTEWFNEEFEMITNLLTSGVIL